MRFLHNRLSSARRGKHLEPARQATISRQDGRLLLFSPRLFPSLACHEIYSNYYSPTKVEEHQLRKRAQFSAAHAAELRFERPRESTRRRGASECVFPSQQRTHQHATATTACGLRGGRTYLNAVILSNARPALVQSSMTTVVRVREPLTILSMSNQRESRSQSKRLRSRCSPRLTNPPFRS